MIITESFVWINFPKTGSTFAREVFRRLYSFSKWDVRRRFRFRSRWIREELLPETRPKVGQRFGAPTPHGRVTQIPPAFRHLPVVSSLRDPFKRAYSLYTYGDWKKHDQLPAPLETILESFPAFPDLSFEEYLNYAQQFRGRDSIRIGGRSYSLGAQSVDFVSFFADSRDPSLNPPAFDSWESLAAQLARVRFLNVDNFNLQLSDFLLDSGFAEEDVRFVVTMPKINESAGPKPSRDICPSLQANIRQAEWLMDLYRLRCDAPAAHDLAERALPLTAS